MFRYLEYYYNRRTFHLLTIIFSAILMVFSAFYLIRLYSVNCVAEAFLEDLRADDTVYPDYSVRISYRFEFSDNAKFIPKKPGDCYDVRVKATLYSGESAEKTITAKNAHYINLYAKDYDGQDFDSVQVKARCTPKFLVSFPFFTSAAIALFFGIPSAVRFAQLAHEENSGKE